ncbi:MAG: cytosine deaminase [Pseudonocardia sp.]|nr:cytosine deaminase [Pseudonocardia sp.]
MLLHGALDEGGARVDVRVDPGSGLVADVAPELAAGPGEAVEDLTGFLLLPAPAEPHAHLDKSLTSDRAVNPTGDLAGAVTVIQRIAAEFTHADLVDRATRAALRYLAAGATAVRTHADLGEHAGVRHVRALVEVRDALRGRMDVQVVALCGRPATPEETGRLQRLLAEAVELGVDLVGGAPHMWADRDAGFDFSWDAAQRHGLPLDLHTDETLDPTSRGLSTLAGRVSDTGFDLGATASHCVSLGVQELSVARKTAQAVAEAGVGVVALPQTNLFLQGRDVPVATPRGLTAARTLLDAGATLGAGGDNLRDPFNPMGRADPTEAASLMVTSGHLSSSEAWAAVGTGARACLGLPAPALVRGAPAELLALRAETFDDAVSGSATGRVVVHRGRVVARTVVTQEFPELHAP